MRNPVKATVLLALICVACAAPKPATVSPSSGADPSKAGDKPFDVQAALARELETLPSQSVSAPGGVLVAQMETSGKPTASIEDGFVHVRAPFGESEFACVVYSEAKDLGEVIRIMADATLGEAAPQHSWIDVHGDQVHGWGYLLARATYVVESEKGKLLGDFKIGASVRGNATAVCLLDTAGHYASFERAVRTFLGSLDVAANRDLEPASRESIARTQVKGRMLGISRHEHIKNADGQVSRSYSTRLTIDKDMKLQTSDSASGEVFDAQGVLQSGSYMSVAAGKVEYEVELALDGKAYQVSGTVDDKPTSGAFKVDGGIRDSAQSNAQVCQMRDGKKSEAVIYSYVPSVEPLKASVTRVVKSTAADADVVATLGEGDAAAVIHGRLDAECDLERGVIKVGAGAVEIERLYLAKAP